MKCNVSMTDRVIRISAGLIIIGLGFIFSSWWGAIGLLPLITGIVRFCPAYLLFGFSSAKEKSE
jgi:hypothetical protein